MQTPAPQKSHIRLATENYSGYIAFCFVIWVLATFRGDAPNIVALKVVFAPFFLLANRAIPTFFAIPIVTPRFTLRSIECHLLYAALFAGFMTIIGWSPERTVAQMLTTLGIAFVVMGITQMLILWMGITKLRKHHS